MLFTHIENSTDSGHFNGQSSNDLISLNKNTDTEDYKSNGIGNAAQISTNQTSNFVNGTLLNSTQTSKVEITVSEPRNANEKDYNTNITNNNNTSKQREEIYNKTVELKEIPSQNLTDKNLLESNSSSYNSSDLDKMTIRNQTSNDSENKTSDSNSTIINDTQKLNSDKTNQSAKIGDDDSNNNNLNNTNSTFKDNINNEENNSTSENNPNVDSEKSSNTSSVNPKRFLQEKEKLISESSNTFQLVLLLNSDNFYKELSKIFLDFEYDDNDESLDIEDLNSNDLGLSNENQSAKIPPLNGTKENNEINKTNTSKKSGDNNTSLNNNSQILNNSTTIKLKKCFISYDEFKNKTKGNTTLSNIDMSNVPESKNLRILVSSSLLEEREFIMRILDTEILGIEIVIYAKGKLKPMEDKIEFGFYVKVLGNTITILNTSLEFKVSNAIKDLLKYNDNLLQQIISLTNFPFEKIIQEIFTVKESINNKLNLNSIEIYVANILKEALPTLRTLVLKFEEELRNKTVINISDIENEFEKDLIPIFVEKYNLFKKQSFSKIESQSLEKFSQTKLLIDKAKILLDKITYLPITVVDDLKSFKENIKVNLKSQLKDIYMTHIINKIIKKWNDWLLEFTQKNLQLKFSLENSMNLNITYINHLKVLSNIQNQIKNSINDVCIKNKNKINEIFNSDLEIIYRDILDSEKMKLIFVSINNTMNDFIGSLERKIGGVANETSAEFIEFKSFIEKNLSLINVFNLENEIENLIYFENLNFFQNLTSYIKKNVELLNDKAIILATDIYSLITNTLKSATSSIKDYEFELSSLFGQIKDKIYSTEKEIVSFVDIFTKKFNSDIYATTLKKRNLFFKSNDIFKDIIDAIKNFENYHDKVKDYFGKLELTKEIEQKVINVRSFLSEGIKFSADTLKYLYNSIEDIFDSYGISIITDLINRRISIEVRTTISDSTINNINISILNFREKFNFSFDKMLKLRNYFVDIIKAAKNKIPNLIKIDGLNYQKSLFSLSQGPSYKKPIPVLFFSLWLQADFRINMDLNIYANANFNGIEIGFNFNTDSFLSASAYVDLYIVRSGVTARANLVVLENKTALGYKFLDLGGQFNSCGQIRVLNVDIGIWIRYLKIKFYRRCWRIRIFRRRITICVPWIKFYYSSPIYLIRYISSWLFNRDICFWDFSF